MWRWQAGQRRHWGEDDGMESEVCHAVALGPDGKVWAATSAGLARFDVNRWRLVGGGERHAQTLGLVRDDQQRLWVAAAGGLRVLHRDGVARGQAGDSVVTDGMRDVTIDRYGRIWGLGNATIALVDPSRSSN
jgi:ligand-binding sensor domain-containing protein